MSEAEFYNIFFKERTEIYKLVGIMEFYRYRYRICKIRNNIGAPPSISILSPLDDHTITYILDVLTECNIDYSVSYRIDTPHFVIHRASTQTQNIKPCEKINPRFSTLLSKGKYKELLEEKDGKK